MGNLCFGRKKKIRELDLVDSITKSKKKIERLKKENNKKCDEIIHLRYDLESLRRIINHYNDVLNKPKLVANAILKTDLNCIWMNDKLEKEYIISIIKFINVTCNDMPINV